jgi:O-acetyl-ADP-ribose deacetylase (regulator of RNase III)
MASELAAAAKPLSIEAIPTVTIGGLPVAVIDRAASARIMVGHAVARRGSGKPPLYVTSANGQVLSMCAADPEMKKPVPRLSPHPRRRHAARLCVTMALPKGAAGAGGHHGPLP